MVFRWLLNFVMVSKALIVMAKRPFAGQTKTRLTPFFSPQEAAALYFCFLQDALDQARSVSGVQPYVAYTPVDEETRNYFSKLAPDFGLIPQIGPSLGERLETVLASCYREGFDQVAAMNSDSPSLPTEYLAAAYTFLDDEATDVVLGPCDDGGYYLIGWKRPHPRLVREVEMSTSHVLADTLAIAEKENLRVSLLPVWHDVDELSDLVRVQRDLELRDSRASHSWAFLSGRLLELKPGSQGRAPMPADR